jgi:hypothetical protein
MLYGGASYSSAPYGGSSAILTVVGTIVRKGKVFRRCGSRRSMALSNTAPLKKSLLAITASQSTNKSTTLKHPRIVFEPIVWKTACFRAVQAGLYGSTATIYKC